MVARMVDARAFCLFTKQRRVEDPGIAHRNNQSATPTTKLRSCYMKTWRLCFENIIVADESDFTRLNKK